MQLEGSLAHRVQWLSVLTRPRQRSPASGVLCSHPAFCNGCVGQAMGRYIPTARKNAGSVVRPHHHNYPAEMRSWQPGNQSSKRSRSLPSMGIEFEQGNARVYKKQARRHAEGPARDQTAARTSRGPLPLTSVRHAPCRRPPRGGITVSTANVRGCILATLRFQTRLGTLSRSPSPGHSVIDQ
jgi:hypothetical protein